MTLRTSSILATLTIYGIIFPSLSFTETSSHVEEVNQQIDSSCDHSIEEDIFSAADEKRRSLRLTRRDQIPSDRLTEESNGYLEGYIQALIDANYYELNVLVEVKGDHNVILYNLPNDDRIKQSIIAFVTDIPEVSSVEEGVEDDHIQSRLAERKGARKQIKGVWFPESTVLFQPIIANPWEPVYSVAYRWGDKVLAKQQIAVSLGDTFPIFRWFNVLPWHGDLQIDIAACMWANFNMNPDQTPNDEWAELVTSDYLLSFPLTYAVGKYSFRLRVYHISSHLGDEFMVNNPTVVRVNPSFEALDFLTSYQLREGTRIYAGPGFVLHSDNSYPMKVFYIWYGGEIRFLGLRYHYHRLYGSPFFAVDLQHWQAVHFKPSATLQLGYEWSKLQGAGRKVRIFAEYHNGTSMGQFFKERTQYIAIRGSWGF